jgi:hypothetical protein
MSKLLLFPQERSPPIRYTTDEAHSANQPPGSDSSTSSTSSQQTWSFEEQFKQVISPKTFIMNFSLNSSMNLVYFKRLTKCIYKVKELNSESCMVIFFMLNLRIVIHDYSQK